MADRKIDFTDLATRVGQFRCMELPGQPPSMHMGTAYLIGDLWNAVEQLRRERDELREKVPGQ